jgi:N-acetylglutamate synthase-like GNAT family acetyltransferase
MKFKFITPSHAYYPDELMLRWEVLCKPRGMPPGSELVCEEKECIHLLVMEQRKVIGCLLFHRQSPTAGKLLQVAISEGARAQGFARKLLHALEVEIIQKGIVEMYAEVKNECKDFYLTLGFHVVECSLCHDDLVMKNAAWRYPQTA